MSVTTLTPSLLDATRCLIVVYEMQCKVGCGRSLRMDQGCGQESSEGHGVVWKDHSCSAHLSSHCIFISIITFESYGSLVMEGKSDSNTYLLKRGNTLFCEE